jgi:hypothetical protein
MDPGEPSHAGQEQFPGGTPLNASTLAIRIAASMPARMHQRWANTLARKLHACMPRVEAFTTRVHTGVAGNCS